MIIVDHAPLDLHVGRDSRGRPNQNSRARSCASVIRNEAVRHMEAGWAAGSKLNANAGAAYVIDFDLVDMERSSASKEDQACVACHKAKTIQVKASQRDRVGGDCSDANDVASPASVAGDGVF